MQGFGTNQDNAAMQHLYFGPALGTRTYIAYILEQCLLWTKGLQFFLKIFVFGNLQEFGFIHIFNKKNCVQ